ncbi:MAG TPA: AAA family ATPase, partial [Cyclobacteriaceae bacterium]
MADNNEGKELKAPAVKYKFRSIKVHSSDEWMADATKKYRQVYDRYETTHLRVELSFFNKLFDEDEWEACITLKCLFVNGSQSRELCNSVQKRKILKDENVVYVRDSWGTPKPGEYWLKGTYEWEAYIDDVKIGVAKFYVEDLGPSQPGENLFFDIAYIKMFEGDTQAASLPQKKYVKIFSKNETRYVWGEFGLKNKTANDYYAELFFNFCDEAGQFKGTSSRVFYIPANT